MHSFNHRLAVVCVLFVSSVPAYAYIDPGTGSALIQGLIAAAAAIGIAAKLYWHRVTRYFSRKEKSDQQAQNDPAGQRENPPP